MIPIDFTKFNVSVGNLNNSILGLEWFIQTTPTISKAERKALKPSLNRLRKAITSLNRESNALTITNTLRAVKILRDDVDKVI